MLPFRATVAASVEIMRRANAGRALSVEHRRKLSEIRKGRRPSGKTIEMSRRARVGLHLSDAHKAKIRNALLGRTMPVGVREKLKAGVLAAWALRKQKAQGAL